ncbi:MAG: flotillin family protein [Deltaproteobacteria bacterium]|nr:flotillin family protein [Deltaproteobacteria bacterium]
MDYGTIAIILFVAFVFGIIAFLASRFRRCPSNQILAVYGKFATGGSVRCYHGGGTFVWPLIQDYSYLDLTPMTINIPLKNALSLQNIRINVPSTFTVAINTTPEAMNNAAVRLLGLSVSEIQEMASEIIFGQLRLTVASLTIEQINQDREKFLEAIRSNIDPELRKVGLYLINVNITDITDESGYIESIGKKAAATAINQAKIDVAEQEKLGAIGASEAEKERRIQVAAYNAQAVEGENTAQARIAAYNADLAEKTAEAERRGQVAEQKAVTLIQKEKALAEEARLQAEEVVPREIEKRKIEIDAEAEAQKRRKEAAGEADAILAVLSAEAAGTQKVLDAKAHGYNNLVTACEDSPKHAATLLMVEKIKELVTLQTEAISNLKIDKITVWDSGSGDKGSSTASFLSNMIKSLPALHDVAAMAGVDLPGYLGQIKEQDNGQHKIPAPAGDN